MKSKILLVPAMALLLWGGSMSLQHLHDRHKNFFAQENVWVRLPSSMALRIAALNYRHFVADLLYIWSIQFYASPQNKNRYDYLEPIFNLLTDINPHYKEFYYTGAWIMSTEKRDPEMALRLFDKAIRSFPNDYFLPFEAALMAAQELHDPKRAEIYLEKALAVPGAPVRDLARYRAHMVMLSRDLDGAWTLWKQIESTSTSPEEREIARKHLLSIQYQKEQPLLHKVAELFRQKNGRWPKGFPELVSHGFLKHLPLDYTGQPYRLDPESGAISTQMPLFWTPK